ncbi:c-type cytochrome [Shewanella sp. AS1]|uniref:c-type cytochrome n=1 Tax=Shewanella sp. AS1 TaxID=2907626 RepID=UPI001F35D191|nr:c-type cytochrome [Shewanella sp. AS1]MCE9679387.1 c-type cytochrome [Shewanella sp. AS1]
MKRHRTSWLSLLSLPFILIGSVTADDNLIQAGEQQARVCMACHQFEPGGVTLVGPPLWGLAERDIASVEGFSYSDGLKQHLGRWTGDKLDGFLASPSEFAPGTKMVYLGVKDAGARAAIIAWLATKNPSPPNWQTDVADVAADKAESTSIKSPGDGILAPGENMALVASVCSACHSLYLVTQQGLSRQRWEHTLEWMVEEQGMTELTPEEHEAVLTYLATNYGP